MAYATKTKIKIDNPDLHSHKAQKSHWHIILKQEGDWFLLLPISSSPTIKSSDSPQKSWFNQSKEIYNAPEKISWWHKDDLAAYQDFPKTFKMTSTEWSDCIETLKSDTTEFCSWIKNPSLKAKIQKWIPEISSIA